MTLLACFLFPSPDRAVPCHIKFLRSQKVVYISCGDEHTAALTKVCTQLHSTQCSIEIHIFKIYFTTSDDTVVTHLLCELVIEGGLHFTDRIYIYNSPDMWALFGPRAKCFFSLTNF